MIGKKHDWQLYIGYRGSSGPVWDPCSIEHPSELPGIIEHLKSQSWECLESISLSPRSRNNIKAARLADVTQEAEQLSDADARWRVSFTYETQDGRHQTWHNLRDIAEFDAIVEKEKHWGSVFELLVYRVNPIDAPLTLEEALSV